MIESWVFLIEWLFACKIERHHGAPLLHFLDQCLAWSDVAEIVLVHH